MFLSIDVVPTMMFKYWLDDFIYRDRAGALRDLGLGVAQHYLIETLGINRYCMTAS